MLNVGQELVLGFVNQTSGYISSWNSGGRLDIDRAFKCFLENSANSAAQPFLEKHLSEKLSKVNPDISLKAISSMTG
jgi:hypothetical protein